MREAQESAENCSHASKLCSDKDLEFVGSMANRALRERFIRMADTLISEHKDRVDGDGNNLLMLATLRGWDELVMELVYKIDIEQVFFCLPFCTSCLYSYFFTSFIS
jgi:hypothetical protein